VSEISEKISHVYSNSSCVIFLQRLFLVVLVLVLKGAGLGLGLGLETPGLGLGLGTLVLTTRLVCFVTAHSFNAVSHGWTLC